MSKDRELDRLKSEEQTAFELKQTAFQEYLKAKMLADSAYKTQQSAWEKFKHARDEMNLAFNSMQSANVQNDSVWNEYKRLRDSNNSQIDRLKEQADSLYQNMHNAFSRATDAYSYGDKADAKMYSNEGKSYQSQLKAINDRIRLLGQEVKNARHHAEMYDTKKESSIFNNAQKTFQNAKAEHKSAEAAFQSANAERKRLYAKFQSLDADYKQKKSAFDMALKIKRDLKKAEKCNDESLMQKAGIPFIYQNDCKVVKEPDGTINFYFGGLGEKDGLRHGHISMDSNGTVTYTRMPMEDHGKQNFSEQESLPNGTYNGFFEGKPAIIKVSDSGNSNQMQVFYGGAVKPDGEGHSHVNTINGSVYYWREDGKDIIDNHSNKIDI